MKRWLGVMVSAFLLLACTACAGQTGRQTLYGAAAGIGGDRNNETDDYDRDEYVWCDIGAKRDGARLCGTFADDD